MGTIYANYYMYMDMSEQLLIVLKVRFASVPLFGENHYFSIQTFSTLGSLETPKKFTTVGDWRSRYTHLIFGI